MHAKFNWTVIAAIEHTYERTLHCIISSVDPGYTVNVDIFACINFRAFPKIGNFARIYFRVFDILASM